MRTIAPLAILLFAAAPVFGELVAPNNSKQLEYRTSWIGNTYGGLNPETGKGQWVQQDIAAMHVTPDGTVYTNVPWEEAGGNCSMYKDGEMLGHSHYTHGWGFNGGKAVAVNDKYVFIALMGNNEGGGLDDPDTWPPKGFDWYGVSRRLRSDFTKGAPFEHGKGGKGDTLPKSFLVVNEVPNGGGIDGPGALTGLWATNERLYVANPLENRIEIYDTETMKKIEEWDLPEKFKGKMGAIAMSPDGELWMLVHQPWASPIGDRFVVFDKDGKVKHFSITFTMGDAMFPARMSIQLQPSAFCFDNKGRLFIADAGALQTIHIFEKEEDTYTHTMPTRDITWRSMIGLPLGGGNMNYGDQMFRNITAIGCDAEGNVYVASDRATSGGGVILESYAPTTEPVMVNPDLPDTQNYWKLNWRLFGLCFIDCATLDPDDETIVYTKEERFKIDWSKEPGKEWTFLGSTAERPHENFKTLALPGADPRLLFLDPRLNIRDSAGVWVRHLDGQRLLFVNDMSGVRLQVYAFDFDTRQYIHPSVLFSPVRFRNRDGSDPIDWMPGQPARGEWIWTRPPGFSRMNAAEFVSQEPEVRGIEGWWVDSKGDVWQTTFDKGLRRFRYQGLDNIGNPIWNFENLDIFPHPAEFNQVKRIRYYPETDTLYLGGCATVDGREHKNQHWKPMGPVLARYDNFLASQRAGDGAQRSPPTPRWKIVLPYVVGSQGHESCEPMGFDVAGDYIFVPYTGSSRANGIKHGRVEVLRADDASPVGWMEPDPKTVGEIGLQDIRECLSAHKLSSGEYVIFLEDDYKAKVVMYRWVP